MSSCFRIGLSLPRSIRTLLPSLGIWTVVVFAATTVAVSAESLAGEVPAADTPAADTPATESAPSDDPLAADPFGGDPFGADPFADDPFGIETTDWDSVFAAVDDEFAAARGGPLTPLLSFGYNKAQGVHFGGGFGLGPFWKKRVRMETLYGYDFARRHSTLRSGIRFGDLIRERRWLEFEIYDDVRGFGSHHPYGNNWFALIGGYDAGSYLHERKGTVRLHWKPQAEWTVEATAARAEQFPLRPRADFHFFGADFWMETDHPSDPLKVNSVGLVFHHRPRYSEDVVLPGLYATLQGDLYGGAIGGDREFSTWSAGARWVAEIRESDILHVHFDWAAAGGRVPRQNLIDLGGGGGLRGFEPRFRTGRQRWFGRAEYKWHRDILRKTRLPWVRKARIRLVPVAEIGAVWGESDLLHPFGLKLSERSDIHWDLGFALRKTVDSSGFLSYLQVNFVWPMGAESGPVRITATLSGKGFDTPAP